MAVDLTPFLAPLTIIPKDIGMGPTKFKLNWCQQQIMQEVNYQLNTDGRVRIVVLKARQLGVSTLTEALAFIMCQLVKHYNAFVMAHKTKASKGLLRMVKNYWKYHPIYPHAYDLRYGSQLHLEWHELESSLQVATAGSEDEGRSSTIHFLHGSEVAFWPNAGELLKGLFNAIPYSSLTFAILESTANGIGNYFYDLWKDSTRGRSPFKPLFFPWHLHPEYRASQIGLPVNALGQLSDEETVLRNLGIDDDRLTWRRYKISEAQGKVETFHQEYPTTPEEAFQATGTNVFPEGQLLAHYKPAPCERGRLVRGRDGRPSFLADPFGPLYIYRHPSPDLRWGQYIIGADPTRTVTGDPACAQVISRRTLEQVCVFDQHINPIEFGEQLALLGYYYNTAIIVPEKTGPGYATIGALLGLNYPRVGKYKAQDKVQGIPDDLWGWVTTNQTKHHTIAELQSAVYHPIHTGHNVGLRIHSPETYRQMSVYITLPGSARGTFGPADEEEGGHDDHVMALAIAIAANQMEAPVEPYAQAEHAWNPPTPQLEWKSA